jgi:nitrate reductase gamma subunit
MATLILLVTAIIVFVAGNFYRIAKVLGAPAHLRWELYPVPRGTSKQQRYGGSYFEHTDWWTTRHRRSRLGEVRVIAEEVLLLKGVWKHNRRLWLWSWMLHSGLYSLLAALAASVVPSLIRVQAGLTWFAFSVGSIGAAGLIAVRSGRRFRPYTSRVAFANLGVLLALFSSGVVALSLDSETPGRLAELTSALIHLTPCPAMPGVLALHVSLAAVFVAYFPFTFMAHMYLKYFTFHSVRWDDAPLNEVLGLAERMQRNFGLKASWKAVHISPAGERQWSELVTAPESEGKPRA